MRNCKLNRELKKRGLLIKLNLLICFHTCAFVKSFTGSMKYFNKEEVRLNHLKEHLQLILGQVLVQRL
jgi:hypothetical protein